MFTKDNLLTLMTAKGKDEIIAAVGQIPEDELRSALVLVVSLYQQTVKIEETLWQREHKRNLESEAAQAK